MFANSTGFLAAFGLTVAAILALRPFAPRLGFVDAPDARKVHSGLVPLCGGGAIFVAFVVVRLVFSAPFPAVPWEVALGFAALFLLGVADDRWDLPALPRLLTQFGAAMLVVLPNMLHPSNFDGFLTEPAAAALAPLWVVFALVLVVGLVNATNMSDGADGLAGGWTASALFWLALIAHDIGHSDLAYGALLLLACVTGFLAFNMRHPWRTKASVFLGDAGSVTLGAVIAYLIIRLSSGPDSAPLVLLMWIVIVPVTDMAILIVRRMLAGRSPMSGDRWHLHHLLIDMGVPHAAATGLIVTATAACGAVAWAAQVLRWNPSLLAAAAFIPVAAHVLVVYAARRRTGGRSGLAPAAASKPLRIASQELEGRG